MNYVPKEIPEGINVTHRHPLVNFAYLLGTVVIVSGLIFIVLGFVASYLATRVSPETEEKIGKMLNHIVSEEEIEGDQRISYLDELLNSLPEPAEKIRLPLKVHLLDSEEINAAIMPGGHVLIHTALLETVKSENELALILAHELGHFQARDPLQGLGRSLVFMVVSAVLGISTSKSGGISEIVSFTSGLAELSYSRKQERAADLYGLARIINHYGHGGYSLDFFRRLAEDEFRLLKLSKYFLTHPLSKERIEELSIAAQERQWKMIGDITPLPEWLHCPDMEECEEL